jgi:hypothetical protein
MRKYGHGAQNENVKFQTRKYGHGGSNRKREIPNEKVWPWRLKSFSVISLEVPDHQIEMLANTTKREIPKGKTISREAKKFFCYQLEST